MSSVTVSGMELEALIKHLLSELRNRETVILENIESLKVTDFVTNPKIVFVWFDDL